MKNSLLTILFSLLIQISFAQTATVRGRVLSAADSTALVGATVMIPGGSVNTMTDAKGYFSLAKVPAATTQLQVIYLGYRNAEIAVRIKGGTLDAGTIYLQEEANEIDAVVVQGEAPPAIQKSDTTQFNASAFKTNPDADADELIMKMPGVVIQNGKVEAQGEPIRKIYVDGRLFFGTDPMAALKNLPADAIESIQIFDEPSEQSRLTGFDDGNSAKAINIVTKNKDKTSSMFKGEASAGADLGGGHDFRYLTGGNFSHFTPNQRLTISALANNVNTMKFGQNDMTEDVDVDANGNLRNQPMGVRRIMGFGVNYSADTKKVRFSGSYAYDNIRNDLAREEEINYYPDTRGNFLSRRTFNDSRSLSTYNNQRLNFRFEWKPGPNSTFVLSPRVSLQHYNSGGTNHSQTFNSKTSDIPTDSLYNNLSRNTADDLSYSVSGDATFVQRFSAKRGRSLSANLSYNFSGRNQDRLQDDEYRMTYRPAVQKWDNKPIDRITDNTTDNNSLKLRITYAEPISPRSRLLLNYVMGKEWGSADKTAFRNIYATKPWLEPEFTKPDSNQFNRMDRNYYNFGGGLGYSYYSKKYNLNSGVDLQTIRQQREEFLPRSSQMNFSFFDAQPYLTFRYIIEKSRYLKVQYRGRTVLPRIEQMQNYVNDNSPNHLRAGNPDLKEGYQHSLNLFYNGSNVVKKTNLTVTLNAATISNFVANSTEVLDKDQMVYATTEGDTVGRGVWGQKNAFLSRYINLNGYLSLRTSATYSFAVRPIRSNVNLGVNLGFIRTPSFYGTLLNYANTKSGSFRLGITSNISENVDFNFYSYTAVNFTDNSAKDNSSFLNQNLYYSMSVILPLGFTFNTLATWKYYTSAGYSSFNNSFFLLDAGIGKKVFRKRNGEFRITAYDLLNQNRNLLHYVYNDRIEDESTNTMGRYILARFSYRFNSMVHGRKRGPKLPEGSNFQDIKLKEAKKMINLPKNPEETTRSK